MLLHKLRVAAVAGQLMKHKEASASLSKRGENMMMHCIRLAAHLSSAAAAVPPTRTRMAATVCPAVLGTAVRPLMMYNRALHQQLPHWRPLGQSLSPDRTPRPGQCQRSLLAACSPQGLSAGLLTSREQPKSPCQQVPRGRPRALGAWVGRWGGSRVQRGRLPWRRTWRVVPRPGACLSSRLRMLRS